MSDGERRHAGEAQDGHQDQQHADRHEAPDVAEAFLEHRASTLDRGGGAGAAA